VLLTASHLRQAIRAPRGREQVERLGLALHIRHPERLTDWELVKVVTQRMRALQRADDVAEMIG
jgi:hypothetical protein